MTFPHTGDMGVLDDSDRQWLTNGRKNHIHREHPPERLEAMMVRSRPGSVWTYCALDATNFGPLTDPNNRSTESDCGNCLRGWYADDDS